MSAVLDGFLIYGHVITVLSTQILKYLYQRIGRAQNTKLQYAIIAGNLVPFKTSIS